MQTTTDKELPLHINENIRVIEEDSLLPNNIVFLIEKMSRHLVKIIFGTNAKTLGIKSEQRDQNQLIVGIKRKLNDMVSVSDIKLTDASAVFDANGPTLQRVSSLLSDVRSDIIEIVNTDRIPDISSITDKLKQISSGISIVKSGRSNIGELTGPEVFIVTGIQKTVDAQLDVIRNILKAKKDGLDLISKLELNDELKANIAQRHDDLLRLQHGIELGITHT